MRASIFSIVAILLSAYLPTATAHAAMQDDVDQAVVIIERFQEIPETAIPTAVMREAKGLAILTVTKAGFIISGRGGTGILVARIEKGWSGPSAIGTGGIGFGFQVGAQVSELGIVLNTPEAVNAFSKGGNVTLGGALSVAAGPIGRDAEASLTLGAAIYTYSRSHGFSPVFPWKVRSSPPETRPTRNIMVNRSRRKTFSRARYSRRPVRRTCWRFYRSN